MKYYFDNRNNIGLPLKIYVDDVLFDQCFLRKNAINLIEINERGVIRFSFDGSYSQGEKVNRIIVDNLPICIEENNISNTEEIYERNFLCPYDTVIDTRKYDNDIIFTPTRFWEENLKYSIYYKAIDAESAKQISMELIKRDNIEGKKKRRRLMVVGGGMIISAVSILVLSIIYFIDSKYSTGKHLALDGATIGILLLLGGIILFVESYKYIGLINENKLREKYIIEDDDISSKSV